MKQPTQWKWKEKYIRTHEQANEAKNEHRTVQTCAHHKVSQENLKILLFIYFFCCCLYSTRLRVGCDRLWILDIFFLISEFYSSFACLLLLSIFSEFFFLWILLSSFYIHVRINLVVLYFEWEFFFWAICSTYSWCCFIIISIKFQAELFRQIMDLFSSNSKKKSFRNGKIVSFWSILPISTI